MLKTIILESGQCSHAKCIFCGYSQKVALKNEAALKVRLAEMFLEPDFDELKVFASGSFLDDEQFSKEFRQWFAKKLLSKNIKKITVESRPEYVTQDNLDDFKGLELTVAIGLESAHNNVLESINKGFIVEDFVRAAELLHENNFFVRTYILYNIPGTTKEDVHESVAFAKKYSDSIIIMNLLPHGKTKLFDLWVKGEWSPANRKTFEEDTKDLDVEKEFQTFKFTPNFPNEQKKFWRGVGKNFVSNPQFDVWQDFISNFFEKYPDQEIALFLPCAMKKPYKMSKTHTLIWKTIRDLKGIHRLVISNPGVIPFQFNDYYPFNSYDWDESLETPEVMAFYVETNKERIKNYLRNHEYKKYFAYFKEGSESLEAVKLACEELNIPLKVLAVDSVTKEENLNKLRELLLL